MTRDQLALLKELTEKWLESDKTLVAPVDLDHLQLENDLIDPQRAAGWRAQARQAARPLLACTHAHMRACNVLDFDDLILLPTLLLQRNEEVRELAAAFAICW